MAANQEFIVGTLQQLLFSPKGEIEGALLKVKGSTVQLVFGTEGATELMRSKAPGARLRVLAAADRSPKTKGSAHPVYRFECLADAAGLALAPADPGQATIKGLVTALHFARHGEPNGVILEGGEFIHLRPRGMAQLALEVGSRVIAIGTARGTALGTRMLEARWVNRVEIT
jgi:hypothetical protein